MTNIRVFAILGVVAVAASACGSDGGGGGGGAGETGYGGYPSVGGYVGAGGSVNGVGGALGPTGGAPPVGVGGAPPAGVGGGATACTPGATQTCLGPGACTGAQVCLADGSGWGPCDCGGGVGGATGVGGGTAVGGGTGLGGGAGAPAVGGAGGEGGQATTTDLVWEFYQDLSGWNLDEWAAEDPPVGTTVTHTNVGTCEGLGCVEISVPFDAVDQAANFRFYNSGVFEGIGAGATIEIDVYIEAGDGGGMQIFVSTGEDDGYTWDNGSWISISSLADSQWHTITLDLSTLTAADPSLIESIGLQVGSGSETATWTNPTVVLVDEVRITGLSAPTGTGGAGGAAGGTGVGGSAGAPAGGAAGTPAGGAAGAPAGGAAGTTAQAGGGGAAGSPGAAEAGAGGVAGGG